MLDEILPGRWNGRVDQYPDTCTLTVSWHMHPDNILTQSPSQYPDTITLTLSWHMRPHNILSHAPSQYPDTCTLTILDTWISSFRGMWRITFRENVWNTLQSFLKGYWTQSEEWRRKCWTATGQRLTACSMQSRLLGFTWSCGQKNTQNFRFLDLSLFWLTMNIFRKSTRLCWHPEQSWYYSCTRLNRQLTEQHQYMNHILKLITFTHKTNQNSYMFPSSLEHFQETFYVK